MIELFYVQPGEILDGTPVPSGYGNATKLDWSNPTPRPVMGWLGPYSGEAENALDRDEQMADATWYMPAGTSISALSRVRVAGVTYQVTGPPTTPWTPLGPHHTEVDLKIVKG